MLWMVLRGVNVLNDLLLLWWLRILHPMLDGPFLLLGKSSGDVCWPPSAVFGAGCVYVADGFIFYCVLRHIWVHRRHCTTVGVGADVWVLLPELRLHAFSEGCGGKAWRTAGPK